MKQNIRKLTGGMSLAKQGDSVNVCCNPEKRMVKTGFRTLLSQILGCDERYGSFDLAEAADSGASTTTNSADVCAGCQKPVSLFGAFGSFGESEPDGVLIEGVPYCWDCADEAMSRLRRHPKGK